MNVCDARELMRLTNSFYERCASSFSASRTWPWQGWKRVLDLVEPELVSKDAFSQEKGGETERYPGSAGRSTTLRIADLACGNLRFEGMLASRYAEAQKLALELFCVDNCKALVETSDFESQERLLLHYSELDLGEALLCQGQLESELGLSACHLSVSFAYMHHLPLFEQRRRLLDALLSITKPLGFVVVSFWQFEQDARLFSKAQVSTEKACIEHNINYLGAHDYLLGWQDSEHIYRYCHHVSDDEIDELLMSLSQPSCELMRFSADGKTGKSNRYVVLQKEAG